MRIIKEGKRDGDYLVTFGFMGIRHTICSNTRDNCILFNDDLVSRGLWYNFPRGWYGKLIAKFAKYYFKPKEEKTITSNKKWNTKAQMWEEKILFYYKYSVWKEGKTITKYKLTPIKSNYITKATFTKAYITQEEINQYYNGNKWIVPTNLTIC